MDDAGASEQKLIEAASNYLQQNLQDAGMLIAEIEPAAITNAQEKKIYNIIKEATKSSVTETLYANGKDSFDKKDYVGAIDGNVQSPADGQTAIPMLCSTWDEAISCWAIPVMQPAIINV